MADQDFNIKVVTTADTSGIKQTVAGLSQIEQMQAKAASAPGVGTQSSEEAARAAYQLGQSLRIVAGGALITAGYKLVSTLRDAATEIEKVSQSLGKQGEQIVANAQKFEEMSKFARDNADLIKIGEGALKGVESAHQRLLEEAGKELTIWQKIADIWAAGFRDKGPIEQAKELAEAQAAQNYEIARTSAIQAIASAKITEARHAAQTYEQTLQELNDRMREQSALADIHWAQKDIQSYLTATSAAEQYKRAIEDLKAAHEKEIAPARAELAKLVPGLSGQQPTKEVDQSVQRVLMNEQAAAKAHAEGREKDEEMFSKSAEAYRRGLTPDQKKQLGKVEAAGKASGDPTLREILTYMKQIWGQG